MKKKSAQSCACEHASMLIKHLKSKAQKAVKARDALFESLGTKRGAEVPITDLLLNPKKASLRKKLAEKLSKI